jgi:hypothetical protein
MESGSSCRWQTAAAYAPAAAAILLPAVLHEGRVREYDTPDNLLAQPGSGEAGALCRLVAIAAFPTAGRRAALPASQCYQ